MPNDRLILGAMSGTSADGVDAALTHIIGRGLEMQAKLLTHAYHQYPPELRKQILETRQRGDVRLSDLAEMGRQVTLAYVEACRLALKQANVSADQVAAVAAHGQTLFHGPPNTIQYFDPSLLAYETGIAVVSDFRRADLAAGGQGAPLVPFADWILFRHPTKSRVLLNIGGIANITYLKAGGSIDDVIAFDTGPGNCISDWVVREYFPDLPGYDPGGIKAQECDWDGTLQEGFLRHPFFAKSPPRSTDGPEMIEAFRNAIPKSILADSLPQYVLLGTAVRVASTAIWDAIPMVGDWPDEVIVAGGGTQNRALMNLLGENDARRTAIILTSDQFGIPTAAREALAFALLGAATLDGESSNVPSATGAKRRVVLGSITPKP